MDGMVPDRKWRHEMTTSAKVDLGNGIEVEVRIDDGKDTVSNDWERVEVQRPPELVIEARHNGQIIGTGRPREWSNIPKGTKAIGRLTLRPESLAKVEAAIAEVESSPEWQDWQTKLAAQRAESAGYEAHRARMGRVMGY
jgi:hypothetical protein